MDSCFALVGAHQHGIASTVSLADHVFYCRGGCKSTPLSQLHTTHVVAYGWELKNVLPRHAYGDGIYKRPVCSTRAKQLSMAATARVIWLCAWVRYWPYRGVGTCVQCSYLVLFQIYLGTPVNFSDPISIRMPWENCFTVPNQQLPLVYGGAGA